MTKRTSTKPSAQDASLTRALQFITAHVFDNENKATTRGRIRAFVWRELYAEMVLDPESRNVKDHEMEAKLKGLRALAHHKVINDDERALLDELEGGAS